MLGFSKLQFVVAMLAVLPSVAATDTTTTTIPSNTTWANTTTAATNATHDLDAPDKREWLHARDPYKICGRGEIWDPTLCQVDEVCVQDRRGYRENFIRVCNHVGLGCSRNTGWACPALHVCYAADKTNPRFIHGECLRPLPSGTDLEMPFKIRRLDEQYPERLGRNIWG